MAAQRSYQNYSGVFANAEKTFAHFFGLFKPKIIISLFPGWWHILLTLVFFFFFLSNPRVVSKKNFTAGLERKTSPTP